MSDFILLIAGVVLGFFAGWYYGRASAYQRADVSSQVGALQGLTTQIAEIRTKFEEMEKRREKVEHEKEKRFKEFITYNEKLFTELKENSHKSDKEKEKRIKEIIERNEKFFKEQRETTEKFLAQQGKSREEIEKQRDAQIADMRRSVQLITRTIAGTKTSGQVGEEFLKEALKNSIKANVVKTNLKTDNGEIEFAWNLGDGKYIPIDSKLPHIDDIIKEYETADEVRRKKAKKELLEKAKKEIERVKKYQNLSNTIDSCILVFQESVLELAPELVGIGAEHNVFVCSYKDVFPIAHAIQDQYIRMQEEGDIGRYKSFVKVVLQILDKILKRTETIEKAVTTIKNANENIKDEISRGKRSTP